MAVAGISLGAGGVAGSKSAYGKIQGAEQVSSEARVQAKAGTEQSAGESGVPAFPQETPAVTRGGSSLSSLADDEKDATLTLLERMMEAQKKAKEQKDRFKLPQKTNYGEIAMEAYSRLARARTQGQVGSAAGYARRQIAQLRAAKRQDSENAPRIQAAINQLERAVVRAGRKKRELDQEQLTEARSRRLEEGKELKKAQTLRQELRRRQRLRMIRERGYIKEAEIDNRCQQEMAATRAQYQASLEGLSGVPGNPLSAQATGGAPAASTGEAAPAPELSIQA